MPDTEPYGSGGLPVPFHGQELQRWAPGQGRDDPDEGVFVGSSGAEDRYRLVLRLGGGLEGEVWAAEDRAQHPPMPCALKLLRPPTPSESRDQQRRWAEQREILLRLNHPGLVRVQDMFLTWRPHRAGQCSGLGPPPEEHQVYIAVMDLAHGRKLADVEATVPSDERLRWVAQLAAAVAYLHRQSPPVLHRDISPNNVVVPEHSTGTSAQTRPGTEEANAVLVDFGLVRIDEVGKSAVLAATRGYCAHEVWNDPRTTSQASDVYGLAATACFALLGGTLSTPPPSTLPHEELANRLYQAIGSAPNRDEIVRTLLAMLDPVPTRRPTAEALVVAVGGGVRTVRINAAAAETAPLSAPTPPHPSRVPLVLGILVALLAVALTASILARPDPGQEATPPNPASTTAGVEATRTSPTTLAPTIFAPTSNTTTVTTVPTSIIPTYAFTSEQLNGMLLTATDIARSGFLTQVGPSGGFLLPGWVCSSSDVQPTPSEDEQAEYAGSGPYQEANIGSEVMQFSSISAADKFLDSIESMALTCGMTVRGAGTVGGAERVVRLRDPKRESRAFDRVFFRKRNVVGHVASAIPSRSTVAADSLIQTLAQRVP